MSRGSGHRLAALIGALAVWQLAEQLQARLPLSLAWAVLDELGHAAVAALVMLWTWPTWGWRPTVAAILAGTLIDVDHMLAAHSFLPSHLMALAARPAGHSLLGVLLAGGVGAVLGDRRVGYAAVAGLLTHIARDAQAPPGVPLLVPWIDDWHVLLPAWSTPLLIVLLVAIGRLDQLMRGMPDPFVATAARVAFCVRRRLRPDLWFSSRPSPRA